MNALKKLLGAKPVQQATTSDAKESKKENEKTHPLTNTPSSSVLKMEHPQYVSVGPQQQPLTKTIQKQQQPVLTKTAIVTAIKKAEQDAKYLKTYLEHSKASRMTAAINKAQAKKEEEKAKSQPVELSIPTTFHRFLNLFQSGMLEDSIETFFDLHTYSQDFIHTDPISHFMKHQFVLLRALTTIRLQGMDELSFESIIQSESHSTKLVSLCILIHKSIPVYTCNKYWSESIMNSHIASMNQVINWFRQNQSASLDIEPGSITHINTKLQKHQRLELDPKLIHHQPLYRFLLCLTQSLNVKPPMINIDTLESSNSDQFIQESLNHIPGLFHSVNDCITVVSQSISYTKQTFMNVMFDFSPVHFDRTTCFIDFVSSYHIQSKKIPQLTNVQKSLTERIRMATNSLRNEVIRQMQQ